MRRGLWRVLAVIAVLNGLWCAAAKGAEVAKTHSVFFPESFVRQVRANVQTQEWGRAAREGIVARAEPWARLSDDELWGLMFGHTLPRSWMVWSNGKCPSCGQDVPMYTWEIDPFARPWKVRCPHCHEEFPKNDFGAFYRSGLDAHGVFDPTRADRSLLFNAEHPDPKDPLHTFGVDDGTGYRDGDRRWRFIGAYLIYGQWKQAVVAGAQALAAAYVVTGDKAYAHQAGVLLDRVADLYPTFDFEQEGEVYETSGHRGYVSVWHDACEETRELVLAYDAVFDGIEDDPTLVTFLAAKAKQCGLANPKAGFADIQRNLEDGLLRDVLVHRPKIESNYPRTDYTLTTIRAVLGWPANREEVYASLGAIIDKMTAVDGVSGEKGIAGYTAFATQGTAQLLAYFSRLDPDFLAEMLRRHLGLRETFRFHIDTLCLGRYYPTCGDAGGFAQPTDAYVGAAFVRTPGLAPSMYTFFWQLYQLTGDAAYVQMLYRMNDGTTRGLPHDLAAADPADFQQQVAQVIAKVGTQPVLGSVNKQQWHLAILRSGTGPAARAAWLDYDVLERHRHADGMNLGLFAKGLDLLPDFGYPPVNYGGWYSPQATWYMTTVSHNTVVVDGKELPEFAGKSTLWADGEQFHAVRAEAPPECGASRYERTVAMVDISDEDAYLLDVFRVAGGADHAKFLHSAFGAITTQGLTLQPSEEYGHGAIMRNFLRDPAPRPGWNSDWTIEDRYHLRPSDAPPVHLCYTDLTTGAQAYTAEAWVAPNGYDDVAGAWIPRLLVRRQSAQAPLVSTFVALLEPYEGSSKIVSVRRLPLASDSDVAVEVRLADGRQDLLVMRDPKAMNKPLRVEGGWSVAVTTESAWLRRNAHGVVARAAVANGGWVEVGKERLAPRRTTGFAEFVADGDHWRAVAGRR